MRRRRTHSTILALALLAAPAAGMTTANAADEPIVPNRCDIAVSQNETSVRVATVEDDLGTGEDNKVPHAFTTSDPDWKVVAPVAGNAYSVAPHTAWIQTIDANWINAKTTYASSGTSGPVSVELPAQLGEVGTAAGLGPVTLLPSKTTFRTTFSIPQQSFLNRLDLTYAADNGVTFLLNGVLVGGYDPPVADTSAFQQLRSLAYAGPLLREGNNTLDAVVTDYGVATGLLVRGGYTGCAVAWTEPGICAVVAGDRVITYAPAPIDLGTGEQNHVPDAYGAVDTKWTTVSPVAGPAYSVAPYPGWYSGSTISNWINATTDPRTGSGIEGGIGDAATGLTDALGASSAAAGPSVPSPLTRRYKVEFTVNAGATYQDLDLRWAADNDVVFLLNDTPIGTFTGGTGTHFQQLNPLFWTGQFRTGTNKLEAIVTDYGVATGLLVQGGARVCYAQTQT